MKPAFTFVPASGFIFRSFLFLSLLLALLISPASLLWAQDFKVGIITSLSGPAAPYGVSIRNSMEFAVSDRPELFKRIKFIYEDVGYDTKQAVQAYQKFSKIDKVDLVYTWGLNFCKALSPVAEAEHVPLIAQCLLSDISKDKKYVLRFYSSADDYMKKQAEMLASKNLLKAALLVTDTSHLQELTAALKRHLSAGAKIVMEESFLPSDNDFRTAIEKIKRSGADVTGVFLSVGQIASFYKQAKAQSLTIPTFGSNWFDHQQEINAAEGAMNGATFVSTGFYPDFQKRYEAKYGEPGVLSFGAPAYELALTIGKLFGTAAGKKTAEEIMEAFERMPTGEGTASGPYYFAQSPLTGRYVHFPVVAKQIRGNKIEVLGE